MYAWTADSHACMIEVMTSLIVVCPGGGGGGGREEQDVHENRMCMMESDLHNCIRGD